MNKKSPRSATTESSKEPVSLTFSPVTAILVVIAFLMGVGIGFLAWGFPKGSSPTQSAAQPPAATQSSGQQAAVQPTQSQKPTRYDVPIDGDPSFGPDNAPITIIEFSDYQ